MTEPKATVRRDPEGVQRRILAAALKEFSEKGYAGARVDNIARRARTNRRMLYYYFTSKANLYREVQTRELSLWSSRLPGFTNLGDHIIKAQETAWQDPASVRLLVWEGATGGKRKLAVEEIRREEYQKRADAIRQAQAEGHLADDLEPEFLLMLIAAVSIYPVAFPQLASMITGLAPDDEEFRRRQVEFLRRFAAHIEASPAQE